MNKKANKGIGRSLRYYKYEIPSFILFYLLTLLYILSGQLINQATQLVIDMVFNPLIGGEKLESSSSVFYPLVKGFENEGPLVVLTVLTIIIVVVCLTNYITHYVRWTLHHYKTYKSGDRNSKTAFRHFLDQAPSMVDKYNSGEIFNFLNGDIDSVRRFYAFITPTLFERVVSIMMSIYFIVRINLYIAIPPIIVGICAFFIARQLNKKTRQKFAEIRQANASLSACIQENINGVRVVRSFATEKEEMEKFDKKSKKFRDKHIELSILQGKFSMLFTFVGLAVNLASIILGVVIAYWGDGMTAGEFQLFISTSSAINMQIIMIANVVGNLQNAIICGNRQLDFIDEPLVIDNVPNAEKVGENPTIEFKNVSLSLRGRKVIDSINLSIPYGAKVGIMGKTGSGKTLLMKLLNRFYDVSDGEILIDGKNLKNYDVDSVRAMNSYVIQDVFLFSDTLSSNVAYFDGKEDNIEKIKDASDVACAGFISSLEDGYNTIVGEKGLGLSGGQKQRVSIARAVYKDAPIILLDDCTSALDYETEKKIIANINARYKDKTVIIATHRATSVAFCDTIVFLEDGAIAEIGTPATLLEKKGKYYEIFTSQEKLSLGEGEVQNG